MASAPAPHMLTRASHRAPEPHGLRFVGDLTLAPARVHEFCGLSRRTLAMIAAGRTEGSVMWIAPSWTLGGPHPEGFMPFVDPGRVVFVAPKRAEDLLWCMEEVLRSGIVAATVADLPDPPSLTAVRRLHLAAETGAAASGAPPLGILLTPEGAAQGVESRWALSPRHHGQTALSWRLERLRARTAPPASWAVSPGKGGLVAETAA